MSGGGKILDPFVKVCGSSDASLGALVSAYYDSKS